MLVRIDHDRCVWSVQRPSRTSFASGQLVLRATSDHDTHQHVFPQEVNGLGRKGEAYIVRRSIMLDIRSSSTRRCLSLSEASSGCMEINTGQKRAIINHALVHTIALRNRTPSLRILRINYQYDRPTGFSTHAT